jgi:hypothetical protein
MSLNKLTAVDKGFDFRLDGGFDELKCNSLLLLNQAILRWNYFPASDSFAGDVLVNTDGAGTLAWANQQLTNTSVLFNIDLSPQFGVGGGVLNSFSNVYRVATIGGVKWAHLSGGFKYLGLAGTYVNSSYSFIQLEITPPVDPDYPPDGLLMAGCVSGSLATPGTIAYPINWNSENVTPGGGTIRLSGYVPGHDISGGDAFREGYINFSFDYRIP